MCLCVLLYNKNPLFIKVYKNIRGLVNINIFYKKIKNVKKLLQKKIYFTLFYPRFFFTKAKNNFYKKIKNVKKVYKNPKKCKTPINKN